MKLLAWKFMREEDREVSVVVASNLVVAIERWRLWVKEFYGLTYEELEDERPVSIELLCDPGNVVLP